ncbi:unnamed protein product [Calypogeia fissa]
MGGAASTPKGGSQNVEQPEYYLEAFVGPKAYNLGSPFWTNLLLVPLNYPWAEDRVSAACVWLARNNRFTGHIVKLLIHVVWSLQEERTASSELHRTPTKAINAVHFSRIFLKYFIEVFNADVVDHLQLSDIDGEFAELQKTDQNVIELVLRSLLTFVGSADVNSRTYLLHLEVVNLLLVMMSTQLHTGYIGAPRILHPFLETAMMQEMDLVGPFVRKLVISYIARLPVPSGSSFSLSSSTSSLESSGNTARLLRRMTSAAASVLLLPYYSYAYLVNAQGEVSKSPLADNSLLLLLVLVHNIKTALPPSESGEENVGDKQQLLNGVEALFPKVVPPGFNPFREALETLQDTNFYPILQNSGANGGAAGDDDLELDAQRSASLKVPYGVLYERLGASIADERSTLLLYSLVHGNAAFLEYVFVRVDLDTLLLPLLEVLYNASRCNSNQIYMLLIILLILSQDSSFNASIHKLMLPGVPWYKERLLPRTSLGSLMVVILIRIVKENLSKLRDVYLHTNCLATLANMAPHCHQLNAYASQCLVTLFDMLARKYTRLSETHTNGISVNISDNANNTQLTDQQNPPLPPPVPEEVPTELHIYTDFLRIVLEIINSILTYALPRNPEVVYALLHRQELFQPYREHPNFQELLANIYTVIEFFSIPLDKENIDGHWSVERVLQLVIDHTRSWRGEGMKTFTQLRFTYEEELHSEDFFTPYVWQLVVAHSGIKWDLDLNSGNNAGAVMYTNNNNYSNGEISPLPAIVDPSTPTNLSSSRSLQPSPVQHQQ